jgi:hypothetical protein
MRDKDLTIQDCLRNAMQCLLKGDTAGRDKWCAMAEKGFHNNTATMPVDTPIPLSMKDVTPKFNN